VRFEVITATNMNMAVFWDVAPCGLEDIGRRFKGAYSLIIILMMGDDASSKLL
jgi:hypothetical protein